MPSFPTPGDRQHDPAVESYEALKAFYGTVPPSRRTMSAPGGLSAPLVDANRVRKTQVTKAKKTPKKPAAGMLAVFDQAGKLLGAVDPDKIQPLTSTADEVTKATKARGTNDILFALGRVATAARTGRRPVSTDDTIRAGMQTFRSLSAAEQARIRRLFV